jgi:hypothetical protein
LLLGALVGNAHALFLLGNARLLLLEELGRRPVLLLVLGRLLGRDLDVVGSLLGGIARYVELLVLGSLHDKSVFLHSLAAVSYLVAELDGICWLHIIDVVLPEGRHLLLLLRVHSRRGLHSTMRDNCLLTVCARVHCVLSSVVVVRGQTLGVDGHLGSPLGLRLVETYLVLGTVLSQIVLNRQLLFRRTPAHVSVTRLRLHIRQLVVCVQWLLVHLLLLLLLL